MAVPALFIKIAGQILLSELSNPDSALRKKFDSMVKEKGGEILGKAFGIDGSGGSGGSGGSDGFDEDHSQEEADRYKRKGWQVALDNALPAAATTIETLGDVANSRRSYLGDALLAVSRAQSDPIQRFNGATIARAAGLKSKGATIDLGTNSAAKIIRDVSADLKRGREQDKQYDVLVKHRPQSGFYESQRKLNQYNPDHSTDGRPRESEMGRPDDKVVLT